MTEFQGLRRFNDFAGPQILGDVWRVQKDGRQLRCALSTHSLGWELRAVAGAELARSQVCKTRDQVFDVSEAWKTEAIAKGWTE